MSKQFSTFPTVLLLVSSLSKNKHSGFSRFLDVPSLPKIQFPSYNFYLLYKNIFTLSRCPHFSKSLSSQDLKVRTSPHKDRSAGSHEHFSVSQAWTDGPGWTGSGRLVWCQSHFPNNPTLHALKLSSPSSFSALRFPASAYQTHPASIHISPQTPHPSSSSSSPPPPLPVGVLTPIISRDLRSEGFFHPLALFCSRAPR